MSGPSTPPLRIAAVAYLNARPLYEGLDREPASARFRLDCATPSEVAGKSPKTKRLRLMPVAAAATIGDLRMVRGCAIGAADPCAASLSSPSSPSTT
jgi:hypothetical protein